MPVDADAVEQPGQQRGAAERQCRGDQQGEAERDGETEVFQLQQQEVRGRGGQVG